MRSIRLQFAIAVAASLVATLSVRAQLSDMVIYKGVTNFLNEGSGEALFFPDTNITFNQEIDLLEPAAEGGGLSDRIIAQGGPANQGPGIYFFSDPNFSYSGNPLVVAAIPETGLPQDVGVLFIGGFAFPPGTLIVASDINDIPEPSAMVLLGFGGLTLLACLRRRK